MFDHVTIRVADRDASERFYATALLALGVESTYRTSTFTLFGEFGITPFSHEHPVTRRLHVGFVAPSREQVDAFWSAGTGAGYRSDGEPGPRQRYAEDYYGAFLLDPDGNSAEAMHMGRQPRAGIVDHLWIRVADLAAATAFYRTIAPAAGLRVRRADPDRSAFAIGDSGTSFTLVEGEPTANLHVAFSGTDDDVHRFHGEALAAGYRDNGPPGERRRYHPGYYAAYVLDPDGNNVEVVDHHRP
jgi:catechol 2,3-dioxygenase-like lactoylglutathione lyase family enzyme